MDMNVDIEMDTYMVECIDMTRTPWLGKEALDLSNK